MIDSHIHLSHRKYDQKFPYIDKSEDGYTILTGSRDSLVEEMKKRGIECCIDPAIDVDSNALLLQLSREYEGFVYPVIGNHPTRCVNSKIGDFRRVREFSKDGRVVAIGETGLDYHHKKEEQHRFKQKIWFLWQINLAHKRKLPLVLHIRAAHEDAIRILRKNSKKLHGGVCHCFSGGVEQAKVYTEELGLCLGIGGMLLLDPKISGPLQQAVASVPIEYLMLETDGPYVKPPKPEGITSKKWYNARNTSLILPEVAQKIAELKNMSVEEVLEITAENTRRVFGIGR